MKPLKRLEDWEEYAKALEDGPSAEAFDREVNERMKAKHERASRAESTERGGSRDRSVSNLQKEVSLALLRDRVDQRKKFDEEVRSDGQTNGGGGLTLDGLGGGGSFSHTSRRSPSRDGRHTPSSQVGHSPTRASSGTKLTRTGSNQLSLSPSRRKVIRRTASGSRNGGTASDSRLPSSPDSPLSPNDR